MANGNEHGPDNLVLRMLRELDRKVDRIIDDLRDLKSRMTALETFVNTSIGLISSVTGVNSRLDRVEARLDRIERRLELSEHPAK
jgi:phage shock protein A